MEVKNAQSLNKEFYNNLYKRKNTLVSIIHTLISFDQQSKSKANYYLVKKFINNKIENVLDYGFGHGSFLLKFPKNILLYGIDISEETVQTFPKKARCLGRQAITATPNKAGEIIKAGSIDLVCLSHVLEHVEDDKEVLLQVRDLLKAGGYVLINVPINEVWKDPKHVRIYNIEKTKQLLNDLNLHLVQSMSFDKLTAFFLDLEKNKGNSLLKKISLKALRFLLSFATFKTYLLLDKYIFKSYSNQQLLVLAQKN